jgi:predicted MPP superfamily phosphohydrolase
VEARDPLRIRGKEWTRREFLRATAWTVVGSGTAVVGYTGLIEPHWEKIVRRPLPVRALPDDLRSLRLLHVSDLHVGPKVSSNYLIEALQRAARLRPDIVVMTGDFLTHRENGGEAQYSKLAGVLSAFPRGRLATVAVLGNHDYGPGWTTASVAARVQSEAERAGIRVLRNQTVSVGGLDIIGVDDLWSSRANAAAAFRERTQEAAIALCHNPDAVDRSEWRAYQGWILAGHTHGGQCKPPFLPPPMLPVENRLYTAGEIDAGGGRRLYINRGLGYLIKVRFNVRPEITLFTLTRAT